MDKDRKIEGARALSTFLKGGGGTDDPVCIRLLRIDQTRGSKEGDARTPPN